jgi:endonuclease/exonuclease/phosphatase (EEP) superfamily protein YafD
LGVRIKTKRPKRSYRAVLESLRQVWKIESVADHECIWRAGEPDLDAFSSEHIRVAIWNMCKGAGGILFEHDFRSLLYRSDLLLAQEALLSQRSIRTFGERGFETIHAASYKRRDGLRDGVMTVSRARSCDAVTRVICKYPEPVFKTPKAALIKYFPLRNHPERLLVINVHATLVRLVAAAVEEMEHLVAHIPAHRGPMILAGDFNTFTPAYLRAVSGVLASIGLEYVPIPGDPRPRTQALDQVFCRGLEVKHAQVDTTVRNSDHFPILLHLALKK